MINNRQNGRRRGRGGGGQRPGGGQGGQRDNGNRIDNRARGNASQLHEKYKSLASDAQRQGDRVNTEYYLQFADHYFRVLSDQRGRYEEQNGQRRQQADQFDDFDRDGDDYGDEGEPVRGDEQNQPRREQGQRDERPRRDDYRREQGQNGQRDYAQRENGQRDYAQRENGQRDYGQRDNGQRDNGQREAEPREARRYERAGDEGREQSPVETAETPAAAAEPRRRGRPRKVRDEDGDAPVAFDAGILPPSLGVSGEAGNDDEAEERPRRRRGRPPASEATPAG